MTTSKPGIGIAGLGIIARSHAQGYKAVSDKINLVGFCDVDPKKASSFVKGYGGKAYANLKELIDDPEIDIVDLILPHQLHYSAAMQVLNAGKHLIIEKPLAPTYLQSMEIYEKAQKAKVHFMVAENTHFVKGYQAAEKIIKAGTIGKVNHVRTFLSSNEKFRLSMPGFWGRKYIDGGGLIMDCGPHSFYLLKWLFGGFEQVLAYSAQVFPIPDVEVEDVAEAMGMLKDGIHYICGFTSTSEIPHGERLEVYGTRGGVIVDQMAEPVVKVFKGLMDFKGKGVDEVPYGPSGWAPGGWHYESVIAEIAAYVDSLLENKPVPIDPLDCAYAIKVIEKAYESIEKGSRCIEVG